MSTTHTEPSRDDIYKALSNRRRRFILHYLQNFESKASLGNTADHVAAWENEISIAEVESDDRKNVYTSLQQFHLPKMEDLGLVEFDERAGAIELSETGKQIDVYMEVVGENELPWSIYYLGLGGLGGSIVTGSALNTIGRLPADPLSGAIFTITSISVLSIIHTYLMRQNRVGEDRIPPEISE